MHDRLVAFGGPSLHGLELGMWPEITFLPPAACGDLLCAALARPAAIALIDGVFGAGPSVWHQEILHALWLGIPVVGGASIGALRAVELATMGMIGEGWIYDRVLDGTISADDEVAVVHAPEELGHRPLSEALANIRFDLGRACAAEILDRQTESSLLRLATNTSFDERSWPQLLAQGHALHDKATMVSLEGWLSQHRTNRKSRDAAVVLDRLRTLRGHQPTGVPEPSLTWSLRHQLESFRGAPGN